MASGTATPSSAPCATASSPRPRSSSAAASSRDGHLAGIRAGPACQYDDMADPRAGQPAAPDDLVNVAKLVTAYYSVHPDPGDAAQRVSFGTSGHRGSPFTDKLTEEHIRARTQ